MLWGCCCCFTLLRRFQCSINGRVFRHLADFAQETEVHFNGFKKPRPWVVIGRFRSILFVSIFQDPLVVVVIMIDGNEKRIPFFCFYRFDFGVPRGQEEKKNFVGYTQLLVNPVVYIVGHINTETKYCK